MHTDPVPIILDVDPGHDDAVAMMLARADPAVDLRAVTAVAGNQTLDKTEANTLRLASVLGLGDIPVAAGMDRPLVREQITAGEVHGDGGLDGADLDRPACGLDRRHAVDLIIELLLTSSERLTLVPTGPLTNIAAAIRREPGIVERIEQIVLMGGAYGLGNATPSAEFNIHADPEAAHIVFSCGRPLVMMGLDITRQAQATPAVVARMRALGNPVAELFGDLVTFMDDRMRHRFGWEGPPLHDPVPLAWLIDPAVAELAPAAVEVELRGEHTYGRTCCDLFGVTEKEPNAEVGVSLDTERFWGIMERALRFYG
ncbi:MAG: nucleoside hydrolase [Synergistales bacterium]|nr:nucleoside hydrolase [Synergistales bacterium]